MPKAYALLLSIIFTALILIGLWIWQAQKYSSVANIERAKNDSGIMPNKSSSTSPIKDRLNETQDKVKQYNNQINKELNN